VLYDGEHYANVEAADLEAELKAAGFRDVVVHEQTTSCDVRAVAYR
jgi:hypothetical protein